MSTNNRPHKHTTRHHTLFDEQIEKCLQMKQQDVNDVSLELDKNDMSEVGVKCLALRDCIKTFSRKSISFRT